MTRPHAKSQDGNSSFHDPRRPVANRRLHIRRPGLRLKLFFQLNRRASSTAFKPPKANEFEIAARTVSSRAWFGTVSQRSALGSAVV